MTRQSDKNLIKNAFTKKTVLILCLLTVFCFNSFSEILQDEVYNFSLDIPEGFQMEDYTEDGTSYFFAHTGIPVYFALKLTTKGDLDSSGFVLDSALTKLSAIYSIDDFTWNESNCAIADFSITFDQLYKGWAVTAPLQQKGCFITLICYAPADIQDKCNQFIMSLLNSLCVNEKYYCAPGIIVSYAFPKEGDRIVNLNIEGAKIQTKIDKSDIESSNFLIEMEYSVLILYAQHPLWKEAWQRYYRLIYRDSFARLENCISDVLDVLYPLAERKNPQNPDLFVSQSLLSWVQKFTYTRNNETRNSTDFTSLPAAICGDGNDCDSRSLLICMFMRAMGYESILLVSPEYSHALATVEMDVPGQKYIPAGTDREFIMGETTAKVTWGMIAQDQADRSKWIPVYLP